MWFPFKLVNDLTRLQLSANEVIWRRGMLIWQHAMSGDAAPAPKFTKEMTDMVSEKFAVIPEMALAIWQQQLKQATRFTPNLTIEDYLKNWAAMHSATLAPLHKRASANQKRLRKKLITLLLD